MTNLGHDWESIEITEIRGTTSRGVEVKVAATGRYAWLPRFLVDLLPGRVLLPAWLARRVMEGKCSSQETE